MPDMENILSSIEALCISTLTAPTDRFNPFIAAMALAILTEAGASATIRRTMGADIDGACGQLRRKYIG